MNLKFKKRNDGFTLVELVVVIAILGILAGVGTVGYSGYVASANKAADKQLVSDITHAAQLAYITDPGSFAGAESVVLSTEDAPEFTVSDDTKTGLETALKAAFGNDLNGLKLKYKEWNGSNVTSGVLSQFKNWADAYKNGDATTEAAVGSVVSGAVVPSFANDVDDLFDLMQTTAVDVASTAGDKLGADMSGAQMVADAAKLTAEAGGLGANKAEEFANAWKSGPWSSDYLMANGDAYDPDSIKDMAADAMGQAIANAGVIKARNISVATWLRDTYPEYGFMYNALANCTMKDDAGNSTIIPEDIMTVFDDTRIREEAANNGMTLTDDDVDAVGNALAEYFIGGQAEKDGLAYYSMMYTVNNTNESMGDNLKLDDSTYWDTMSSAVSMYGAVAQNKTNVDDLSSAMPSVVAPGEVLIVMANKDGMLTVNVSPVSVQVG